MNISITGPAEIKTDSFRESVVRQLTRVLARFSHRITRVDIALTDENGPRGGVDKQCRISVRMPGFESCVTTAKNENPLAAVAQAAARARRMVMTRLKRPRSLRDRSFRNRWRNSETADLVKSEQGE